MPFSRRSLLVCAAAAAASVLRAADVPRPSPDFSINMPDGSKTALKSFRGKIVVLTFISTTCSHCQEVTRVLTKVQEEYGPKGVQVLMSATDPNAADAAPAFIERFQPAFPVGYNDLTEALIYFGASVMTPGYVPKMAFLDRQGVIRVQHAGEDGADPFFRTPEASIRSTLDELLKVPPAKAKSVR